MVICSLANHNLFNYDRSLTNNKTNSKLNWFYFISRISMLFIPNGIFYFQKRFLLVYTNLKEGVMCHASTNLKGGSIILSIVWVGIIYLFFKWNIQLEKVTV